MFTPRIVRPVSNRASQCLRVRLEASPRYCRQQQRYQSSPASRFLLRPRVEYTPIQSIAFQFRQQRYRSTFRQNFTQLYKEYPVSVSAAVFFIFCGVGAMVYTNYLYNTYFIGAFHKFPDPVAKQLRKAIYYANYGADPKLAVKYYREALRVSDEIGMDPFSDEIMGVKIELAAFYERIQRFDQAIGVLEIVKGDNLKWMEVLGKNEGNEGKRTKVLGKTVAISVKLGELYSNEYVMEKEKAEECLVWAVETSLKEQQRREKEGVREGNWLSAEEIGGSMEALGHHYEEKNVHYLAAPLFLQALSLSPPKSCHTVVLMNNLAISLAQQAPPPTSGPPPASRTTLVDNAKLWSEKAIALAATITPPGRTEECDIGCAVATHNLGEFFEMNGNNVEARKRYEEAKSLAQAIGFQEGVINSEEGLRRVATK